MAFAQDKIEELRGRADIVEVIGAHVRLRRVGNRFIGLCPFHNEKTPSFSVSPERGFFHCFGCGAGGTVFNFVMQIEGLSFPEAMRSLAARYGITLPERGESGAKTGERDALYRANEVAADFYAHVLWNIPEGAPARDYLKSRGVADDTARAFKLGFAPARAAALTRALERRGLLEAGRKLGLVKQDANAPYDMFRARLMFPIRDVQGRTIAFGGRVLDDRLPKYINSAESPLYSKARNAYGLYEARQAIAKNDRAIVVEGYLDAIAVSAAGFKEVVASLGTSLTVDQLRLLGRHTRNVIACFDGDAAGRKASLRALEVFLAAGLLGRGIFIPTGFDPDTLIRDQGAARFSELIESSELLIDYFISEQAGLARQSLEERARAAQRVTEMLRIVANPFEFDLLARKAADALEVGEEVLRREASRQGGASERSVAPLRPYRADALSEAAIGLLAIALAREELRETILNAAPTADFTDAGLAAALGELCRSHQGRGEIESGLAERLSADQHSRLSALMISPALDDPKEARKLLDGYLGAIERARHQREIDGHKREAVRAETEEAALAAAQSLITVRREEHRSD